MRFSLLVFGLLTAILVSGCTATDGADVLQSQSTLSQPAPAAAQPGLATGPAPLGEPLPPLAQAAGSQPENPLPTSFAQENATLNAAENVSGATLNERDGSVSFASDEQVVEPILRPRNQKTYLINGLASSVGSIGYGFTNLSKKIPGSVLHNYATFVESSTVIRAEVTRELKAAYRADPNVEINMIGISFGANIVTLIAADLDRAKIPVNYLVTMEGPAMVPIRDNVRKADNFSCTNLDCFRTSSKLMWGNKTTEFDSFKIKASHIPLANHPRVHERILSVLRERPPQIFATQ